MAICVPWACHVWMPLPEAEPVTWAFTGSASASAAITEPTAVRKRVIEAPSYRVPAKQGSHLRERSVGVGAVLDGGAVAADVDGGGFGGGAGEKGGGGRVAGQGLVADAADLGGQLLHARAGADERQRHVGGLAQAGFQLGRAGGVVLGQLVSGG